MSEPHSKNFPVEELRCKCPECQSNVPNEVNQEDLDALQRVRDAIDTPLVLTSAYRCANHPREASKRKPGRHHYGDGFDIRVPWGRKRMRIVEFALKHGFKGFGYADTFLHIDRRSDYNSWSYK